MPVDTDHGTVAARDSAPSVIYRGTNTIVIPLHQDEILTLIRDLAESVAGGGPGYLIIEHDEITHPRSVFEDTT